MIEFLFLLFIGYIIFAVILFPLIVMLLFAIGVLWPYLLAVAAFWFIWKITSEKGDRGDRG